MSASSQAAADRAAADRAAAEAEAARKALRRAAIQAEISQWQIVSGKCVSLMGRLQTEKTNLNNYVGDWQTQYSMYAGSPVTNEVVIKNVFEGVCADKIKEKLHTAVEDMNHTESSMQSLSGNIDSQINAINNYNITVQGKIAALQAEMASLA